AGGLGSDAAIVELCAPGQQLDGLPGQRERRLVVRRGDEQQPLARRIEGVELDAERGAGIVEAPDELPGLGLLHADGLVLGADEAADRRGLAGIGVRRAALGRNLQAPLRYEGRATGVE